MKVLNRQEGAVTRRVLIAEDSDKTREQLKALLEADNFSEVETAPDGRAALAMLSEKPYSVFLTDLRMPGLDGLQLMEKLKQAQIPTSVIVMTGYGSITQAVQAMRLGAYDFLPKPVDIDHLKLVIERVVRERRLFDEVVQLREQLRSQYAFHNVLSKSPVMDRIFELVRNVAPTTTTVLIEGETGTGKEQIARAIHAASGAFRTGELVAVNCAAVPETLLESELFGHEKGSFTNAVAQRKGRFEQAHGGTMFLDEVGDIPAPMQIKLLRVLQERRFERVGGNTPIEVDVRLIAATNRDLGRLVRKGKFREDLFYRLNVVRMSLPPLRERKEDIPLLATHFAEKYNRPGELPKPITPEAMERLLQHTWPGNIRELENVIERACVVSRAKEISVHDLPPELANPAQARPQRTAVDLNRPLPDLLREAGADLEMQYLRRAMRKARGNVGRCARICGLSRRSVSAKLAQYGIDKDEYKGVREGA
jgi:DNA-binding NtrC family response regulator